MAKIKVNHFAAKTVGLNQAVDWETVLTELFIGVFLGVFAYMGYVATIPLLLFPCAVGAVLCAVSLIQTVHQIIRNKKNKGSNE